jgi:glycosyltransferase involved in cell wall biosynthesis
MGMRITFIADPVLPVPPLGYGGAERNAALICEELVRRGHRVRLLASKGSKNYDALWPHRAPGSSFASRAYRKILFQGMSLSAVLDADIVHNIGRIDYLWALFRTKLPIVITLQNDLVKEELLWLADLRKRLALVSPSDSYRRHLPPKRWWTIYNAVDSRRIPFQAKPAGGYLAFLGRMTFNKGVHLAIQVAKAAKLPLKIAGNISKETGAPEFFEREVRPQLGGDIEWVGEINDEQKPEFLGNARALLFPIQWEEPFGMVVAESMAAGTPVLAMRRGAMPEVIEHGVNGMLCDTVDEMVAAVARIDDLDRAACRRTCEQRFSPSAIVDRYLEVYGALMKE